MTSRFGWCLGFCMFVSGAHAACPAPLPKAQPGWFAEVYDKRVPFDDKQGLINPPPSASMNLTLPVSFAQLDPGGNQFPNVAFTARFRVCEAGSYEFYAIIQETGNRNAFSCNVTTRVNGSRIADTYKPLKLRETLTTPGRISLEPGWAEIKVSMACGGSSALGFYRKHWPGVYVGVRVRGPNDNVQRDFAQGEIVSLGRETMSGAPAPASPQAAPPPLVAPAAIPEQPTRRSRQNLQFN